MDVPLADVLIDGFSQTPYLCKWIVEVCAFCDSLVFVVHKKMKSKNSFRNNSIVDWHDKNEHREGFNG